MRGNSGVDKNQHTRTDYRIIGPKNKKKKKTYIYTLGRQMFVILARIRRLGALLTNHAELLGREHGLPFGVRFLDWVVGHVLFCGGGEQRAQEWDGGHRTEEGRVAVGERWSCCCGEFGDLLQEWAG